MSRGGVESTGGGAAPGVRSPLSDCLSPAISDDTELMVVLVNYLHEMQTHIERSSMPRRLGFDCIVALLADLVAFTCLLSYIFVIKRDGPHVPNPATGQTIVFNTRYHMTYISQTQAFILRGLALLFVAMNFIVYVKLANSFLKN